jgi:DsbC/DsbD-like thiol-disulfide interchange protein
MVALSARAAPIDGVEVGPASWPTAHTGRLAGLDEEVGLHEGIIHGSLPLTFAAAPGAGDHEVKLDVTYQACSDALCLPPSTIELTLPVTEVALVDRTLPTEPKSG